MARAGHPPPARGAPGRHAWSSPTCPAGPPLGLGGLPFETAELELAEGSQLVLYTDGLIEDRDRDIDDGPGDAARAPWPQRRTARPEETCTAVLDALLPGRPSDDIALIVARTRVLDADRVADWEVPSDPAAVAEVRGGGAAAAGASGAWTSWRSPPS